jgi:hypothetical protein
MITLDDLFKEYLHRIEPTSAAVKRAREAHKPLRDDLKKDEKYGPFVERTLLSGSYGRDTSTFFIKDVDVIIQTTFTIEELRRRKHTDETEQHCLLRLTKEAIDRTGRVAKTRTARRSIHVTLPEEINDLGEEVPELTMDIVPVLIQTSKEHDPMTIADKDLKDWFDTYPITQLDDSCARNDCSFYIIDRHSYKPLVKIFKAWKQVHFGPKKKTPKGLVLECLTAQYHNPNAEHWVEAVRDLWQNISNAWPYPEYLTAPPGVSDISDLSPRRIPIAKTVEEARGVLKKIQQHLDLVNQALEEAEEDVTKAAKTLQRVFGQDCEDICFPLPTDLVEGDKGDQTKSGPFSVRSRSDVKEAPAFG